MYVTLTSMGKISGNEGGYIFQINELGQGCARSALDILGSCCSSRRDIEFKPCMPCSMHLLRRALMANQEILSCVSNVSLQAFMACRNWLREVAVVKVEIPNPSSVNKAMGAWCYAPHSGVKELCAPVEFLGKAHSLWKYRGGALEEIA
eukprot:scaffold18457_cov17-Prasinocladus_malaysianus.AAC.1